MKALLFTLIAALLVAGCAPGGEPAMELPRVEGYDYKGEKVTCEPRQENQVLMCPLYYDLFWGECKDAGFELIDCNGCSYLCSGPVK